jgi:hypothetical protein
MQRPAADRIATRWSGQRNRSRCTCSRADGGSKRPQRSRPVASARLVERYNDDAAPSSGVEAAYATLR